MNDQRDMTLLMMIYGQSKLYKTSLALFIPPELRPVAFLDADGGAKMRLALLTMTAQERDELGIVEKVPEGAGPWMREQVQFYRPRPESYYEDCMRFAELPAYTTKVWDSVSRGAEGMMKQICASKYTGQDTKRVTLGTGQYATVHPTLQDYGCAQERVMNVVAALDEGLSHTVLLSHEKTGELDDGAGSKRVIAGPRAIGVALLEVLPSVCDVVIRLEPKTIVQAGQQLTNVVMRTRNHAFYLAGDRSGMFPDGAALDAPLLWKRVTKFIETVQGSEMQLTAMGPSVTAVPQAQGEQFVGFKQHK